jgi:hypothetical protein
MTLAEGVILCILGTTLTIIGLAIAYYFGSDNKEKNDEEKQKERFKKIFPSWH